MGDFLPRTTFFVRPIDDLVVNIGDIRDQADFKARPFEVTPQNVVHQSGSTVTKVRRTIDSGAAQVNTDFSGCAQSEFADL
jgi:hypothetical protein